VEGGIYSAASIESLFRQVIRDAVEILHLNTLLFLFILIKFNFFKVVSELIKEKEDSSPFTDRAYDVYIEAHDQSGQDKAIDWLPSSKISNLGYKLLFAFFDFIRSSSLHDNYARNLNDEFGNISGTLFKNFNLDNLDDKGSLEGSIENYIEELEQYHFFLPKRLTNLIEDKKNMVPLESGIGYEADLDSVLVCFRDLLKSLRDEKIRFWKRVFEMYKEDKEAYDLEFRTKQTRRKDDLDRFSKIDIKEYIDKLGSIGKRKENNKDYS